MSEKLHRAPESIPPIAEESRRDLPEFVRTGNRLMSIGGRRVPAASGQTLPNVDPTTEQPLASVPRGEAADVDAAVRAARKAFVDPEWAGMTPDRRGRILNQIADVIEAHAEELATIDSVNMGAPRMLTRHMLAGSSEIFRYYAGWPSCRRRGLARCAPRPVVGGRRRAVRVRRACRAAVRLDRWGRAARRPTAVIPCSAR